MDCVPRTGAAAVCHVIQFAIVVAALLERDAVLGVAQPLPVGKAALKERRRCWGAFKRQFALGPGLPEHRAVCSEGDDTAEAAP